MKYESFKEFELYYSEYYSQKKYKETIDILNKASEVLSKKEYEENLFTILFDKSKVYMLSGEYNKGLKVLEELVNKGFACPLSWGIFKPLFKEITYLKLKRKNLILRSNLQEKTSFIYEIHLPKNYIEEQKYPVFLTFMEMEII